MCQAKLLKPMLTHWSSNHQDQGSDFFFFNQNKDIFDQENAFENVVCKTSAILFQPQCINSLWPNDPMLWHRSGSTLAQVMAWCHPAPSHYLDWCWLTINKVQWLSSESNFTKDTSAIDHQYHLENNLKFCSNFPGANELIACYSDKLRGSWGQENLAWAWPDFLQVYFFGFTGSNQFVVLQCLAPQRLTLRHLGNFFFKM